MQLREHLGARKPLRTILFVTLDNLGARIPPKTLLFVAPESLGRQNSSENTAVCCSGAPWARTTAQPLNDRKSFSATLYSVASQWAPSNTVHFMHGFTLVYIYIYLNFPSDLRGFGGLAAPGSLRRAFGEPEIPGRGNASKMPGNGTLKSSPKTIQERPKWFQKASHRRFRKRVEQIDISQGP